MKKSGKKKRKKKTRSGKIPKSQIHLLVFFSVCFFFVMRKGNARNYEYTLYLKCACTITMGVSGSKPGFLPYMYRKKESDLNLFSSHKVFLTIFLGNEIYIYALNQIIDFWTTKGRKV